MSNKITTQRQATAEATLHLSSSTLSRIRTGDLPKGDPLPVARVAAIQAAKNTAQIIPYCHPLPIDFVGVEYELAEDRIVARVTVKAIYKTGVEMEALTAASVAVLTIYDMTKMVDEAMHIGTVTLLSKRGGKSDWMSPTAWRAAVVVVSDSVAAGLRSDGSGSLLVDGLIGAGAEVVATEVVADDRAAIAETVRRLADETGVDVIVTTGGTGLGPRDGTPDALAGLFDRPIDSIADAVRAYGQARMPAAMLSRGTAGVRGQTLIVALPGAPRAVDEALPVLLPVLPHAVRILAGDRHDP